MKRYRTAGFTGLVMFMLLVVLLVAAGCSSGTEASTPVSSVESLLDLRYERSTDASAYARYIAAPDLAAELAQASAEETTDAPPTPRWEIPYVSEEGSSSVNVVVVWKPAAEFEGFPPATVFVLEKVDGAWKAVDAQAIDTTAAIPARKD